MAMLLYRDADGVDHAHPVALDPILIGRAIECQIQSQDGRVSRRHARIFVEDGAYWIEDLGSSNGVFIDGRRVTRELIPGGSVLLVGSLMCRLVADGEVPVEPAMPEPAAPPAAAAPAAGDHTMAVLVGELETARVARRNAEEERDALGLRLRELHTEMKTVKSAAAAEEEARTARLGEAEREAARLNKEVAELRKDHAELGRRATALEAEKEALAAQKAQLETERRTLADATRAAEAADQGLREAVDAVRDQLAGAR
ncbi:MAG: FHA domain-containing protein, partial [Gammaproteobacteria bacterium]